MYVWGSNNYFECGQQRGDKRRKDNIYEPMEIDVNIKDRYTVDAISVGYNSTCMVQFERV